MQNCATTIPDNANYSAHYAGIDNPANAKLLFTSEYAGGLRVLDISNPYKPVEIAYYHPAPLTGQPLVPGGQVSGANGTGWEAVPSYVHYDQSTGNIWFSGFTSGFNVVHLTSTAGPLTSSVRMRPMVQPR